MKKTNSYERAIKLIHQVTEILTLKTSQIPVTDQNGNIGTSVFILLNTHVRYGGPSFSKLCPIATPVTGQVMVMSYFSLRGQSGSKIKELTFKIFIYMESQPDERGKQENWSSRVGTKTGSGNFTLPSICSSSSISLFSLGGLKGGFWRENTKDPNYKKT